MGKVKGIIALSRALAKKKKHNRVYTEGSESEKAWINFQVTKGLKRQFRELCDEKKINASEFVRKAMELFIENEGSVEATLHKTEE